ncbi:MAG: sensor histidine kinase, partial [Oscillospiraceae bacterium]
YRTAITLQEQANRLEKEKQFLSNSMADISHQLKTPLTSLIMISDLLQANDLKEPQARELLHDMKTILNKLEWLITSLLSFAKFDSGQIQLKSTPLNLANIIIKVLKSLEIAIEVKDIKIITSCDENITILADEQWICEALQNILKNCVEYTNTNGNIYISAANTPLYVELTIKDTGVGINEQDLPHIFDRFYKGKNSKESSVGIGLAFAKAIITKQNGHIEAESELGVGTTFVVKFYK